MQMAFLRKKEDQVTVLGTTERKQSKMMLMFTVDTLSFGCLASIPFSTWGEPPACASG